MRVTVLQVDGSTVRFACACGTGIARWVGPAVAPGDVRLVELASHVVLAPGPGVRAASTSEPAIHPCGTGVRVTCRIIERFEEGAVHLGCGDGSLMLDVHPEAPWPDGSWLTMDLPNLTLFDTRV